MSTQRLLEGDWSEYDDRKKRGGSDSDNFSCTEEWEIDYLVRKIREQYPGLTETSIKNAISACCKQVPTPRPRKTFVTCVMKRLGID